MCSLWIVNSKFAVVGLKVSRPTMFLNPYNVEGQPLREDEQIKSDISERFSLCPLPMFVYFLEMLNKIMENEIVE